MGPKKDNGSSKVIDLMVSIDFVLRTCAESTVVKVKISNRLGSKNGLIHVTLIPMGKIVSVYELPSGTN
jgi:hypothetical protein